MSAPETGATCALEASQGRGVTLWGALINLVLAGIKLLAGLATGSQALVADAVHSLSDLFSDVVVLAGLAAAQRPADLNHHFGHRRLETLASILVGLLLAGAAVVLGLEAWDSLWLPAAPPPGVAALIAAAVSIAAKEVLFRWTRAVARRIGSRAVEANAWHHRSDALSSVAVLVGVAATWVSPALARADAVAALVVAALVLWAGLQVIWQSGGELLDQAPPVEIQGGMDACARSVEGVRGVHDLRVRTSGGRYLMELHVEVDAGLTVERGHALAKEVEACLKREFGLLDTVTIHVDPAAGMDLGKEVSGEGHMA